MIVSEVEIKIPLTRQALLLPVALLESVIRLRPGDSAKVEGVLGQLREVESESTQQVSQ